MTIAEFLLARIGEDEAAAQAMPLSRWTAHPEETGQPIRAGRARIATCAASVMEHVARHDPARVLAECKAKRAIVELHKAWPVLVQQPAELTHDAGPTDLSSLTFRMTQRMDWLTAQQYRERFGEEPPTAPMLAALAAIYADHPDFQEEWRA